MVVFSEILVVVAGMYLAGLGIAAFVRPQSVSSFLLKFASSARAHYLEMAIRLILGLAFILSAPGVVWPLGFQVFGWVLVLTTVPMVLMPWQWHHKFAQRFVPPALRFLKTIGLISFAAGLFICANVLMAGF
ncbi:MAG: hypothetical protein H6510_03205 [Acidobacteria bacterium]|nr:hypothetical protein [Acidobacteriota bacterium]MCB9396805.1 hypothetical protein [Acidobacteriota bacterium]